MSSGLTIVAAISTAAVVIVVTLLVSKLVRGVVGSEPEPAVGGSGSRRPRRAVGPPVSVRPATVAEGERLDDELRPSELGFGAER